MEVSAIQSLTPEQLFENFELLNKLNYFPSEEFQKFLPTSRVLDPQFFDEP